MTKSLVPYKPNYRDLPKTHADFHLEQYKRNRQALLLELRCISGFPKFIRSLKPDTLYRVVVPNGKLLQKGKDGLFSGVQYGKSGIKQHARFAEVNLSFMEMAKTIGSQFLLISIAMQLNRIENMVENISKEMHQDRISEVQSGVNQFEYALLCQDDSNRNHAIQHAIQTLHTGLHKTITELKNRIAEAPNPENRIIDHIAPWNNKAQKATRIMGLAQESLYATLIGIKTLAEAYSALREPNIASKVLCDYLDKVHQCNVEAAVQKARLVECSGSTL
ncbi:MAG: hypothetical protein ABI618_20720, partial [Nitrospirota bacterium]